MNPLWETFITLYWARLVMSEDREFEELDIDGLDEELPPSGKVRIQVESTVGPSHRQETLEIARDASIRDIKQTLATLFGLPDTQSFHIVIGGRTCDDDDIVDNYDVEDGDTMLIIPFSMAGVW